jgi:hypothetical protein
MFNFCSRSNNSLGDGAGTLGGRIGYHDEGGIGILPRTAINHVLVCPNVTFLLLIFSVQ